MTRRTALEASINKRSELKRAEAAGEVADSHAVRLALMARVHSGEITLQTAQAKLRQIKCSASANGKVTRSQAFNRG